MRNNKLKSNSLPFLPAQTIKKARRHKEYNHENYYSLLRPIALAEKKLLTRFWATIAWRIPSRWSTMWLTSRHSVKEEMEHKMVHFVCEDLCQRWDHNIEFLFSSFLVGEVHTRSEEWGSTLRHFLKFCINSHSVKCVTGKPVCTQIILMFDEGFHLLYEIHFLL